MHDLSKQPNNHYLNGGLEVMVGLASHLHGFGEALRTNGKDHEFLKN